MASINDYENLLSTSFSDANASFQSNSKSRWERKKLAASSKHNTPKKDPKTPSKTPSKKSAQDCRFIPNRGSMDLSLSKALLNTSFTTSASENNNPGSNVPAADPTQDLTSDDADTLDSVNSQVYGEALAKTLSLEGTETGSSSRILSFKEKAPAPKGDTVNNLQVLYSQACPGSRSSVKHTTRHIPSAPSRILDAPDLLDDYYLNLLHWSSSNILAVALSQTVYLWNASSGSIAELCSTEGSEDYISSVKWVQEGGQHLAIGTSEGKTQLWDVNQQKQLRSMDGHEERIGALSWNKHLLSSGSRDSTIVNHDVRVAAHAVQTLRGHTQEVCGLEWSPDGSTLASGGNDNKLCLWDVNQSATPRPRFTLTDHQAAVKALAWSPHDRNLLATGGGTADRCIKFWNSQTGSLLNSIDTGSQVCALQWNRHEKEILSSHGFAQNQLCLWKYPTMTKVKELKGHTARVLHMSSSPDGSCVVSAAADETLRLWDVFGEPSGKGKKRTNGSVLGKGKKLSKTMHIR
jgi:cell division cycle protein 20 (cofactor of APC complex)